MKNAPSGEGCFTVNCIPRTLNHFWVLESESTCKARIRVCYTPPTHLPGQEPGKIPGMWNTRIFLTFTFLTLILSQSVLYKCSSNAVFPFSGNQLWDLYQSASLQAPMRSHGLMYGMIPVVSVCWPWKSESPFWSCPCNYLYIFKYRLNNLCH